MLRGGLSTRRPTLFSTIMETLESMKATVQGLVERVNDLSDKVRDVTKDKPMRVLGSAFAIGAVIGAVLTIALSTRKD